MEVRPIIKVDFLKSVAKVSECPKDDLPEVAVIWRSNVWKSSLINLLMQKTVAKASDKPWKTQLINYFLVNDSWYLVDLPWYGYAKSSLENRRKWIDETYKYFITRKPLVLLLIDWSIPPQNIDLEFMQELQNENLDFIIVVTKIDKASQKEVSKNMNLLKKKLSILNFPEIFLTSSVKKRWSEALLQYIEKYF